MSLEKVARELDNLITEKVLVKASLKEHTTWRIGGPADLLICPTSIEAVQILCNYTHKNNIPLEVIGNGSNLLISDGGIRGVVLKLHELNEISFEGNSIKAQSGVLVPKLVTKALQKGLTGLEFGSNIPASVGGATIMNAGAHRGQMADFVQEVKVVSKEGRLVTFAKKDLNYSYRNSSLKGQNNIVVETTFKCQQGSVEKAKEAIKATREKRKATQPLDLPNAGSVFKNPQGDSAGRLIEQVGLKGFRYGDAQVSEKHANFIVNLGSATAEEVLAVIERVQNLVAEKFGINLEPEVLLLGR